MQEVLDSEDSKQLINVVSEALGIVKHEPQGCLVESCFQTDLHNICNDVMRAAVRLLETIPGFSHARKRKISKYSHPE